MSGIYHYQATAIISLPTGVRENQEFMDKQQALSGLVDDAGYVLLSPRGDAEVVDLDIAINGYFTKSTHSRINALIEELGRYCEQGAVVNFLNEGEEEVFFVGPDETVKRRVEVDYRLEQIRLHLMKLEIAEDPSYEGISYTKVVEVFIAELRTLLGECRPAGLAAWQIPVLDNIPREAQVPCES